MLRRPFVMAVLSFAIVGPPADLKKLIADDSARWGEVIRGIGITQQCTRITPQIRDFRQDRLLLLFHPAPSGGRRQVNRAASDNATTKDKRQYSGLGLPTQAGNRYQYY